MKKLLAGLIVPVAMLSLVGCGGSVTSPSKVAEAAGATSCDNSGFYVKSRLTGEKDVVYDCRFAGKLPKCVTYAGNIASDATEEVQLLFESSIGSGKPACLAWLKAAKDRLARNAARQAAARRAARQQAFAVALKRDAHARWHQGYTPDQTGLGPYELPNVFYKSLSSYSCADYATSGCWKIAVITRNGCPTGVSIELEEIVNSAQVGTADGASGALPPETQAIIEIDSDQSQSSLRARIGSITCD